MKELIYIGEQFTQIIPAKTKIVIGNKTTTVYEYENSTSSDVSVVIDTLSFTVGNYAVVTNSNGSISIAQVQIVDPLASSDELNDALTMIKEIDQVLEDRAKNAVSQITINNKTIINSSFDSLLSLRAMYVKKVNKLRGTGGVFKSVTVFKGK
ncbi:hypothetical protein AC790_08890 [Pantoea sp. RIT-PI-b]|uniref:hypothetical protein n=1 Tax=Pantoea sp. RIT-PI-b TaxID=1681195 RepID=UPI0006766D43|nr:hypothetical protein [Pantoea sp. RIT-PI-b]KNC14304.1 hypothetical protein AC790_08890 [Pantoea sp. RIT-PI-b]